LIGSVSPTELRQWLDDKSRNAPLILDVREDWEYETCHIAGSRLIPMQEIPSHLGELPRTSDIVVVCHHGARSLQVATYLAQSGFGHVHNLSGGIAAWADQVDSSMPRY
jgi:rhodanese-related sulfurtransferase